MSENIHHQGFVLDFRQAATQMPSDAGAQYVAYEDWRLHDPFLRYDIKAPVVQRRAEIAQPVAIAHFSPSDLSGIRPHNGIAIKTTGENRICLPGEDEFAVSLAHIVGHDVLKLYGPEAFENASISLVVEHGIVPKRRAQRPQFSGFHDHVTSTPSPADLIYTFHTILPTEFKLGNQVVPSPEMSLCRFGGEFKHRSVENLGEPVERTWGAFIVERRDTYRDGLAHNPTLYADSALLEIYAQAAAEILEIQNSAQQYAQPVRFFETEELGL